MNASKENVANNEKEDRKSSKSSRKSDMSIEFKGNINFDQNQNVAETPIPEAAPKLELKQKKIHPNDNSNILEGSNFDKEKIQITENAPIHPKKEEIENENNNNQDKKSEHVQKDENNKEIQQDKKTINEVKPNQEIKLDNKEETEKTGAKSDKKKIPDSPTKAFVKKLLDDYTVTIIFTILTVYALFADDIKMMTVDLTYDIYFSIVVIIVIFLFTVEFVLSCLFIDKYFLSFFFFLDFFSIISMFLDIHWLYNAIINPDANNYASIAAQMNSVSNLPTAHKGANVAINNQQGSKVTNLAQLARATRGARVGSRAIRILRILRLVRLIRIAKLYKAQQTIAMKNKKTGENIEEDDKNEVVLPEESKVGKKLSDLTTKRVIILVLSMMIAIMLFDPTFYYDPLTSMSFGILIFNDFPSIMDPNLLLAFNIYVDEHKNVSSPILYARVVNLTYGNDIYYILRDTEKIEVNDDCSNLSSPNDVSSGCYALFDNRSSSKLDSLLNIIKTIFICIVLTVGSMSFSKDTNDMVLEPIESMITKIKNISENPLEAMQKAEEEEFVKNKMVEEDIQNSCCNRKNEKKEAPLETVILEKTITKIGALLALGFGEAGSEIIAKNMQNNEGGDVNPMIPGKKVMAIYGFCDIRNFTDTTEVLQESVMIFVNEIAEIVHDITSQYSGSANKNIGDAFLLVWKFEERFIKTLQNGDLELENLPEVSQIIEMSVVAFIKILKKIYKSYKLDKYRKNPGLRERINNYSVKLGFGLHVGWSIEGAIGSTFKIDASYLSPHVNMASKLEEKTKDYGAQLILSEQIVNRMTERARKFTRPIDKIRFNEGEDPITIYTVDLDLTSLKIEDENIEKEKEGIDIKFEKVKRRNERKLFYHQAVNEKSREVWDELENDEEFNLIRRKYKPEFYNVYNLGFEQYLKGEWEKAKESLEKAQEILGEKDGPSKNILEYMGEQKFKSYDWHGFKSDSGH